jgi:preprotein translocase subunit SecY
MVSKDYRKLWTDIVLIIYHCKTKIPRTIAKENGVFVIFKCFHEMFCNCEEIPEGCTDIEYKITVWASSRAGLILRTFFISHFIFIMILFHVFVLSFFVLYVESKTLRNISQDYNGTDHGVNCKSGL